MNRRGRVIAGCYVVRAVKCNQITTNIVQPPKPNIIPFDLNVTTITSIGHTRRGRTQQGGGVAE